MNDRKLDKNQPINKKIKKESNFPSSSSSTQLLTIHPLRNFISNLNENQDKIGRYDRIQIRLFSRSSRLFLDSQGRGIRLYRLYIEIRMRGRGVFGSRRRFTVEQFYRRHFVALHFHAVNVAASFCARVCVGSKKRLLHVAYDGDPCRRGNAEYRREVQPLFPKLLAGFAILRTSLFLVSTRLRTECYSKINILYSASNIKLGKKFSSLIQFIVS